MNALLSTVRKQFNSFYLIIPVAVLMLAGMLFSLFINHQNQAKANRHQVEILETFSHLVSNDILAENKNAFLNAAAIITKETAIQQIQLLDISGTLWAGTAPLPPGKSYQTIVQELRFKSSGTRPAYLMKEDDGHLKIALEVPLTRTLKYFLVAEALPASLLSGMQWVWILFIITLCIAGLLPGIFFLRRTYALQDQIQTDQYQLKAKLNETIAQKNATIRMLKETEDSMQQQVDLRTAEIRKHVEEKILLEEQYRKVVDASPVPLVVFNMDGTPIHVNPAFTGTFGWTLEEFRKNPTQYIPKEA